MANEIPPNIVESIAVAGLNAIGGQPATLSNLALGNAIQSINQSQQNIVSFQQTQNAVQATILGKVVNMLTTVGPVEAVATEAVLTANAVAQELGALHPQPLPPPYHHPHHHHHHPSTIPMGEPGSSLERPITCGRVVIDPLAHASVNLIITDRRPAQGGMAPPYPIRIGDLYVYDNPDENICIIMTGGNIEVTRR